MRGSHFCLLLLRAHVRDVGHGQVVLDAERAGERAVAGADDLFEHDRAEAVVLQHAGAAELLGNREADDAGLARGEHGRAVDLTVGVPLLALVLGRVALEELLDDVAERLVVFVVDVALHVLRPFVGSRRSPSGPHRRGDSNHAPTSRRLIACDIASHDPRH